MPFIGNQPALSYTSFAKQDFTTSATTSYTLDNPVANENELALFINFVRQEPTTAYTASGTTLTLTSATSASDDMYCVFLGKAIQTVNPPSGSVGTSQIVDASITSGKLASGVLPNNTPAFESYLSANQSISDSTATKVQFNTERFDTDSCYDNATNYRFTPTVAGKYFVYANVVFQLDDYQIYQGVIYFYKNGSNYHSFGTVDGAGSAFGFPISTSAIIDMNGTTDYIEVFGQVIRHSSTGNRFGTEYRGTYFGAYRIGN